MADLTPLDILGVGFPHRMRGYDTVAVRAFLQQLAGAMEELFRERGELRQTIHRLEQELGTFRERESALQDALVAAQKTAENTMETARIDGQHVVDEGHRLAERLVDDAYQRAQNIEGVIGDLRSRRREVRADLMRLTELLQGMIQDDQQLEKEDRATPQVALLHRREDQRQA
ncbi:MAG: DivIVA domain-containing protein [Thermoanaerobaculales bacterium]|nr:DivIVA domain-containing protein [Thermoanaerobaculales bacterium]